MTGNADSWQDENPTDDTTRTEQEKGEPVAGVN